MRKGRVFIIHGWGGYPDEGWLGNIKLSLQEAGFSVYSPAMPDTHFPKMERWIDYLDSLIIKTETSDCLIGYSLGAQAIMRYLEQLPYNSKIKKALFVAGFFKLTNLDPEEEKILSPWIEKPINLEKVKRHAEEFTAIFSRDDPIVPLSNKDIFSQTLKAKIIIKEGLGHFDSIDDPSFIIKEIE